MCSDEYLTAVRKKVLANPTYAKSINERKIVIHLLLRDETNPILIPAVV